MSVYWYEYLSVVCARTVHLDPGARPPTPIMSSDALLLGLPLSHVPCLW